MVDLDNLLVQKVTRTPLESDKHYSDKLDAYVSQLRKATSTKSGKRISDPQLLQVLHPAENTLGYIFLLNGLTSERTSDLYVISLVAFLTQFDPVQARYAGAEWRRVIQIANEVVVGMQDVGATNKTTRFCTDSIIRPSFSCLFVLPSCAWILAHQHSPQTIWSTFNYVSMPDDPAKLSRSSIRISFTSHIRICKI